VGNRESESAGQGTLVTIARYSISGRLVGNRGEPAFLARVSAPRHINTPAKQLSRSKAVRIILCIQRRSRCHSQFIL